MARAMEDKGEDYLLPIKVEEVDIDGLRPTIGYLSLDGVGIEHIAELLISKLRKT